MAQRRQIRVSEGLEARSERPTRGHGRHRAGLGELNRDAALSVALALGFAYTS